ncbi:MAG: DsrE family protein [Sulfuricurvum sp.]|nr:DsrE family protein [Sulfuricurvum sp.]
MKKWLLILSLSVLLSAEEIVHKVVFNLTTGDLKTFEKIILSGIPAQKTYFENKMEELNVAVVIHGDAYKFFLKDPGSTKYKNETLLLETREVLEKRLQSLSRDYHVEFLICAVGMKKNDLTEKDIYPFVTPVANSTIGLIEKQNEGYAYIPVH